MPMDWQLFQPSGSKHQAPPLPDLAGPAVAAARMQAQAMMQVGEAIGSGFEKQAEKQAQAEQFKMVEDAYKGLTDIYTSDAYWDTRTVSNSEGTVYGEYLKNNDGDAAMANKLYKAHLRDDFGMSEELAAAEVSRLSGSSTYMLPKGGTAEEINRQKNRLRALGVPEAQISSIHESNMFGRFMSDADLQKHVRAERSLYNGGRELESAYSDAYTKKKVEVEAEIANRAPLDEASRNEAERDAEAASLGATAKQQTELNNRRRFWSDETRLMGMEQARRMALEFNEMKTRLSHEKLTHEQRAELQKMEAAVAREIERADSEYRLDTEIGQAAKQSSLADFQQFQAIRRSMEEFEAKAPMREAQAEEDQKNLFKEEKIKSQVALAERAQGDKQDLAQQEKLNELGLEQRARFNEQDLAQQEKLNELELEQKRAETLQGLGIEEETLPRRTALDDAKSRAETDREIEDFFTKERSGLHKAEDARQLEAKYQEARILLAIHAKEKLRETRAGNMIFSEADSAVDLGGQEGGGYEPLGKELGEAQEVVGLLRARAQELPDDNPVRGQVEALLGEGSGYQYMSTTQFNEAVDRVMKIEFKDPETGILSIPSREEAVKHVTTAANARGIYASKFQAQQEYGKFIDKALQLVDGAVKSSQYTQGSFWDKTDTVYKKAYEGALSDPAAAKAKAEQPGSSDNVFSISKEPVEALEKLFADAGHGSIPSDLKNKPMKLRYADGSIEVVVTDGGKYRDPADQKFLSWFSRRYQGELKQEYVRRMLGQSSLTAGVSASAPEILNRVMGGLPPEAQSPTPSRTGGFVPQGPPMSEEQKARSSEAQKFQGSINSFLGGN